MPAQNQYVSKKNSYPQAILVHELHAVLAGLHEKSSANECVRMVYPEFATIATISGIATVKSNRSLCNVAIDTHLFH